MPDQRWNVSLTSDAVADKYKVSRGEAAQLRDALAMLYHGPAVPGCKPYADGLFPDTYEFVTNGYRIIYEVMNEQRTIRVIFFELEFRAAKSAVE